MLNGIKKNTCFIMHLQDYELKDFLVEKSLQNNITNCFYLISTYASINNIEIEVQQLEQFER